VVEARTFKVQHGIAIPAGAQQVGSQLATDEASLPCANANSRKKKYTVKVWEGFCEFAKVWDGRMS
jgi:hypothetical protein